ncbi:unnamed protein product [Polarella glacialis]|uniref:Nudix hydrolase domain-containing protein n=1 Tax=Polarella glacialis TaxID=89957 RepID=A0A813G513_POLGL|nr:unnamed protein product [Polarella glacialis]
MARPERRPFGSRGRLVLGMAATAFSLKLGLQKGVPRGRRCMAIGAEGPLSPTVEGLLRRVRRCNNAATSLGQTRPFLVQGSTDLGMVLPEAASELARFPEVFRVTDDAVELIAGGDSVEARTLAVAGIFDRLREEARIPMLKGWRDEAWSVKPSFHSEAALVVERAAGPLLGVRAFGCHINGLVSEGGKDRLWVARRAATKQTYPSKLDHMVAGGLSHGEQPTENVIRECWEEARIPPEMSKAARSTGIISYCMVDPTGWGINKDAIFCYDLELDPAFRPVAGDGEVESFDLWDMKDVVDSLIAENDDWKPNVALVIIDMLIRRGHLAPEEAGYGRLARAVRQ